MQYNHMPLRLAALEPAQTLRELCNVHGMAWRCKTLGRFGLTLKITLYAAEQAHPDVAQDRQDWADEQPALPAGRLIGHIAPLNQVRLVLGPVLDLIDLLELAGQAVVFSHVRDKGRQPISKAPRLLTQRFMQQRRLGSWVHT